MSYHSVIRKCKLNLTYGANKERSYVSNVNAYAAEEI